jgi:hypothetical protein
MPRSGYGAGITAKFKQTSSTKKTDGRERDAHYGSDNVLY